MGWEDTCARRPGMSTSGMSAPTGSRARVSDTAKEPALAHVDSNVALLETPRGKAEKAAEAAAKPWTMQRTVAMGALFVAGLWVFCFAMSHLLIHALLRVTY